MDCTNHQWEREGTMLSLSLFLSLSLSLNYICTSHNKKKRKKKKNYIYALNEGDGVSILTIGQLTKVANLGCVGWTFAL